MVSTLFEKYSRNISTLFILLSCNFLVTDFDDLTSPSKVQVQTYFPTPRGKKIGVRIKIGVSMQAK